MKILKLWAFGRDRGLIYPNSCYPTTESPDEEGGVTGVEIEPSSQLVLITRAAEK
jgi:hypothetical protein